MKISSDIKDHFKVDLPEGESPRRMLPNFGTVNFATMTLKQAKALHAAGCTLLIPMDEPAKETKSTTKSK